MPLGTGYRLLFVLVMINCVLDGLGVLPRHLGGEAHFKMDNVGSNGPHAGVLIAGEFAEQIDFLYPKAGILDQ